MIKHLLASSIAIALASGPAGAAVVCEFEPTADLADCSRCFKSDGDGTRLILGGALAASSTHPDRFAPVRIGEVVFQRGLEKEALSKRNGKARLFEVCYESVPPVTAPDLQFKMTPGSDIQEFELLPGSIPQLTNHTVTLTNSPDPAEGSVGLFGSMLVFSPSTQWVGRTELKYEITGRDGQTSAGRITIVRAQVHPLHDNQAERERVDAALRALEAQLVELELQLEQEAAIGIESQAQVLVLEQAIEDSTRILAELDQRIVKAREQVIARQREKRYQELRSIFVPYGEQVIRYPVFSALSMAGALPRNGSVPGVPFTEPPQRTVFLVPVFATPVPLRRFIGQQPQSPDGRDKPRRQRMRVLPAAVPKTSRRLSKRDKKLAKRKRKRTRMLA